MGGLKCGDSLTEKLAQEIESPGTVEGLRV
jgi:hypothetical protein